MKAIVYILSFFGFGGKSLDGILGALGKLDTELEAFEDRKATEADKTAAAIAAAKAKEDQIAADLERSYRVRCKVKDLIS